MKDFDGGASAATSPPAAAEIRYDQLSWDLGEGGSLRFGRSSTCEICVGRVPEDDGIPRRAGVVLHIGGQVWVRSTADNPIYLRREVGPELVLDSKGMLLSPSARPFNILLKGRILAYTISVAPPYEDSVEDDLIVESPDSTTAETFRIRLTPSERKLVVALCERLLTCSGEAARPATYDEIARRLGRTKHGVRNQLDSLRQRLRDAYVPGLGDDYNAAANGPDAKDVLAMYMWTRRIVTSADLILLDASAEGSQS